MLYEFVDDLRSTVAENLKIFVPTHEQVAQAVDTAYQKQMLNVFLWRTGTPIEFLDILVEKKNGSKLAQLIKQIAQAGNTLPVNVKTHIPRHQGLFDLNTILPVLIYNRKLNIKLQDKALEPVLSDPNLRSKLIHSFA